MMYERGDSAFSLTTFKTKANKAQLQVQWRTVFYYEGIRSIDVIGLLHL